ncbi:hypothetical protein MMC28_011386 [Mycoblastus sanguinarius]|nr:hypothetical protein [Mycoblastus sanguinarius]
MATLLALSTELIIVLSSFLSKPSHMLHLALVNKQLHGVIISLLYDHINFVYNDHPAPGPRKRRRRKNNGKQAKTERHDYGASYTNIMRLSSMLQSKSLPPRHAISHLTIDFEASDECNKFQTATSSLLPHISSLKYLSLRFVALPGPQLQQEIFSFALLATALRPSSGTLRELSLLVDRTELYEDGWTIGNLRHFHHLEVLRFQGDALLDDEADADLDDILPIALKFLWLHWNDINGLSGLQSVLERLTARSRPHRALKNVFVQFDSHSPLVYPDAAMKKFQEVAMKDLGKKSTR